MTTVMPKPSFNTHLEILDHFCTAVGSLNGSYKPGKNNVFAGLLMAFSAEVSRLETERPDTATEARKARQEFGSASLGHGFESHPAIAGALQQLRCGSRLDGEIWPALYILANENR